MYYERLALRSRLLVVGLKVIKPPVLRGESGVEHRFSLVAVDGPHIYGFDIYPDAGAVEVLRTYIKKLDIGASTFIVCLSGKPSDEAQRLASGYGIRILGPGEIEALFTDRFVARTAGRAQSSG